MQASSLWVPFMFVQSVNAGCVHRFATVADVLHVFPTSQIFASVLFVSKPQAHSRSLFWADPSVTAQTIEALHLAPVVSVSFVVSQNTPEPQSTFEASPDFVQLHLPVVLPSVAGVAVASATLLGHAGALSQRSAFVRSSAFDSSHQLSASQTGPLVPHVHETSFSDNPSVLAHKATPESGSTTATHLSSGFVRLVVFRPPHTRLAKHSVAAPAGTSTSARIDTLLLACVGTIFTY
jgi:hypothetical protein